MEEYDFFIYKGVEKNLHPYSPCYHNLDKTISTGIIEKAKCDDVDTFIVSGLALNFCAGEGALDLINAGFKVIFNLGASRAIGDATKYIEILKDKGVQFVDSADEIGIKLW